MKIAILSFYSGYLERGVENWAKQLSKYLNPNYVVKIFQNKLVINPNQSNSSNSLSRRLFIDYWSRMILRFTIGVLPELDQFDVIIPTNGGWESIIAKFYCTLKRKKMIIVGHSGVGWDDRINLYCFPDVFIGLSQHSCNWAKKVNPFVKVVHIPNGVDLNKFSPTGDTVKLELAKPIVLAIGALEVHKQLDLTIRAVADTPASLLILGDGDLKPEIQSLGDSLMPGRFLLLKVPFDKVATYCRAANVFTLASWNRESYPLVYFEAMACNLPIVATNDAVRREIIEDAGVLVDPHDIKAYSRALEKTISTNWANMPRKQAEKFAWQNIARQYEKMLMNI